MFLFKKRSKETAPQNNTPHASDFAQTQSQDFVGTKIEDSVTPVEDKVTPAAKALISQTAIEIEKKAETGRTFTVELEVPRDLGIRLPAVAARADKIARENGFKGRFLSIVASAERGKISYSTTI